MRFAWTPMWRRYRTEILLFGFGVIFFGGGLANLIAGNRATPSATSNDLVPSTTPGARPFVGPPTDTALDLYIAEKMKLLEERASKDPGGSSPAVVSYDSYLNWSEASSAFRGRKVALHSIQVRIPLPGLIEATIVLGDRDAAQALEDWKSEQSKDLEEEARELERLIPTVTDQEFREVYRADAEIRRKAVVVLGGDSSIVYAVSVRASHSDLLKISRSSGVRLVDVPSDRGASFETHDFTGVMPESV